LQLTLENVEKPGLVGFLTGHDTAIIRFHQKVLRWQADAECFETGLQAGRLLNFVSFVVSDMIACRWFFTRSSCNDHSRLFHRVSFCYMSQNKTVAGIFRQLWTIASLLAKICFKMRKSGRIRNRRTGARKPESRVCIRHPYQLLTVSPVS
jgi:hypothetical protein